ncbi:MAG: ABC transporter ATP-binding protein [Pelagimonas sp.]
MTDTLLSVQNVSVQFKTATGLRQAVKDVSFDVAKGETLAVVGESGSGKSVTARVIMGMLAPNARVGEATKVVFDGDELTKFSELQMQDLRGRRIAMIFQEPLTSLNPLYRIGDQVGEIIKAHHKISRADLEARVLRLLEEVRLPDPKARLRQYPHELSGGQRQRVMIAMALANNPDLLIADEPTTALDVTVQAEILALLRDLQKSHNMGMVLITHDLSVVRAVSDNVVVMRHGEVVERGATQTIFETPSHAYTQHLISSEPKGEPSPVPEAAPPLMVAENARVEFTLKQGGMFSRATTQLVAVNDVSVTVRKGETVGIVGESGSGKTTFGMSVIGLGQKQNGPVTFDGDRIEHLDRQALRPYRPRIQVVFQDPFSSLNPRMIIRQILEEGLIVNGIGATASERLALIKQALDDVQMPHDALDRFPHEFSGGQRQRLAIARAIVLKPEFILLDEPTSALDLSIQAQIIELLRDLRDRFNLSYLFISHDLKVVRALCHRVIVMKSGSVVEEGPTAEVLETPQTDYTRRLVRAAFDVVA